jgi:hypothetical protein
MRSRYVRNRPAWWIGVAVIARSPCTLGAVNFHCSPSGMVTVTSTATITPSALTVPPRVLPGR